MTDFTGLVVWNELNTWKPRAAKAFYSQVFGWTFANETLPGGENYITCKKGDLLVAGIFTLTSPDFDGMRDMWMAYLGVDDVDRTIEGVLKSGGKCLRPPFDVPGVGRFAILLDSVGAYLAIMKPSG